MKVLLYFENYNMLTKSGIGRALKLQMEALSTNGVEFTLDPNDTYDIAHINTYWEKSWCLLKKCRKKNIPVIVHGHSIWEDMAGSFSCWQLANLYTKPAILRMYRHADFIISPTKFSADTIRGYKGVNCEVVPLSNGIDIENYQPSDEKVKKFKEYFKLKEGQPVVMCVGIPFKRKGFYDVVKIAKDMPDVTFIWFGGLKEILLPKKNVYLMHHHPKNMIMPGYIDSDVIKGAFLSSSLVFFPSLLETEGIVVLEALASKTPLLVRDIPVYEDWLTDGVDCYKAKDNEGFEKQIRNIIASDNSKIVTEGYKKAEERDIKKIGASLKKHYEYVIENYKKK